MEKNTRNVKTQSLPQKTVNIKMKHGGKRKGAGRKPLTTPKKTVSVKLDPAEIDKLNAICAAKQISQAGQVSAWINTETK